MLIGGSCKAQRQVEEIYGRQSSGKLQLCPYTLKKEAPGLSLYLQNGSSRCVHIPSKRKLQAVPIPSKRKLQVCPYSLKKKSLGVSLYPQKGSSRTVHIPSKRKLQVCPYTLKKEAPGSSMEDTRPRSTSSGPRSGHLHVRHRHRHLLCVLLLCVWWSSSGQGALGRRAVRGSSPNDIALSVHRLTELGTRGQALLRNIAIMTQSCNNAELPQLRRKRLRHSPVTCNDGSYAGYYIRKSAGSSKWIVFLEGGWFCFDKASCAERRRLMPDFMSSRKWPRHRKGSGILSWDPEENPYYYQANMVLIPYCSSDSWSGTKNKTRNGDFAFMGSLIVEEVIKKLMKKGLRKAKKLILTGSSAGGTGVLVNIDRVSELVKARAPQVEVRGLVDAGWFLDNEPYRGRACHNAYSCSPIASIQRGIKLWEPRLPRDCSAQYSSEIWRCYFGHRLYPTLKTEVYIVQNLYDAAQIKVDNVFDETPGADLSREQWRYLLQLGEEVKATLMNTSAAFAPACVSHDVLLNSEWHKLSIDGVTLAQSIYCWEEKGVGSVTSSCHHSHLEALASRNDTPLADAPPSAEEKRKLKNKNRKKRRRRKNRRKKNRGERSGPGGRCRKHLLDRCPWPHCNCSCPRCRWPHTMKEVNQYFMKSLASVMDIEPSKMENVQLCGY
ncbi:palmitoleoyl-protein carboxylesterase NOTUM-like [Babylonia areolata]|uniref:palmitoleoyl-protein carboxylesterase NOTUM-like n=1 Tax=Babylonia areolata TaxID=304850 RepID=UPI003FD2589E